MATMERIIGRLDAKNPNRADLGVCVAPLRATGGCMDREPEHDLLRANFHLVVLCTGGSGDQVVDLTTYHHEAGSLVWIRPGQVHQRPPAVQGTVVCFTDDFIGQDASLRVGPASWRLGPEDLDPVRAHLGVLAGEYERFVFGPTGRHLDQGEAMLRHVLVAFLLRIGQAPATLPGQPLDPHPVARAFCAMVEQSYASVHSVAGYANALGYSSKTITRASLEATGLTPKQVIDGRRTLEARRLLAHTDLTVCTVGRQLGFEDPANFCKFFTRATGMSPGAFRASHRI